MRRVLSTLALGAAFAAGLAPFSPARAGSLPALYVGGKKLGVTPAACVQIAASAMSAAGIQVAPQSSPIGIGGATQTTRVFVVCVERPKDGFCGAPGATAVVSAAGPDAAALIPKVVANLVQPKVGCL